MKFELCAISAVALAAALAAPAAQAASEKPYFAVLPSKAHAPLSSVPAYTYKWSYNGRQFSAQFVGTNPKGGSATTIPVYIFPVALTCKGTTYSALDQDKLFNNGKTVLDNTIASPIFQTGVDFKSGGQDFGSSQYIDAYARGDFWGAGIKKNKNWHLTLGAPQVQNVIKYTASNCSLTSDFGVNVINMDINEFDSKVIGANINNVPSGAYAIYVTTQTYLTSGGCCIGGYHSQWSNGVTYSHFTYIQKSGAFSQNVSALSHEAGEWDMDPFTTNTQSPCGGLLENGDPLEGKANYGGYPYTLNGNQYVLQDLVYITYFGAPLKTSVGKQTTFQGENEAVCQNGQ